MGKFGAYNKFTAQAGQRDALVGVLLDAAAAQAVDSCELYIVNVSESEPDAIWVTEIWASEADQQASLALESTKAVIRQAIPLIAGPIESIRIVPVGGKGFATDRRL